MRSDAASAICRWHSAMVAPEAVAFARQVVALARPASAQRAKALLFAASRLGEFALSKGLELRPAEVLSEELVERFVIEARSTLSPPTRRTLRTNLRALARALEPYPAPPPVPLPRERAKKPYSQKEISAYLALADAQPTPARRNRASALICLGAGAGLAGADLRSVRGSDVKERSGGVVTCVSGHRARVVPVLARYRSRLLVAAEVAGEGHLVSPGPCSRNVTGGLVGSLAGGGGLPRLEVSRLRATWLAEVAQMIGLGAFMEAAGVDLSQRLGDICAGLAPWPEGQAVALLGGRDC